MAGVTVAPVFNQKVKGQRMFETSRECCVFDVNVQLLSCGPPHISAVAGYTDVWWAAYGWPHGVGIS